MNKLQDMQNHHINPKLSMIYGGVGETTVLSTSLLNQAMKLIISGTSVIFVLGDESYESMSKRKRKVFDRSRMGTNYNRMFLVANHCRELHTVDENTVVIIDNINHQFGFESAETVEDFIESIGLSKHTVICSQIH